MKMHGLGCIELTYDSKEWVLTLYVIFTFYYFQHVGKNWYINHRICQPKKLHKTRYSDNGSKGRYKKEKKTNSIIHPTSDRP